MSRSQRNAATARFRTQWAADRVGQLPASTTYEQFLRRQGREFQDSVLGPTRGIAFRKGLDLDELVTTAGRRRTLVELRRKHPTFFLSVA